MADMVRVHNKLNQKVEIAVLTEEGVPEAVSLAPRGRFGPVDKARLGKVTKNLADRGFVKIRPV